MKSGLDYFLADVKSLTKQKPPFNEAFTSRCVNVLGTAVTIIEGLKIVIDKNKAEIESLKVGKVKVEKPKGERLTKDLNREEEIVSDFKSGMKKRHIAAKFKVTPARISQILERNGFPPIPWESRK
jgi:hypothetical protein